MQPNLGVELRSVIFQQIDESTLIAIQDIILDKIEFWLPFVEVKDIQLLEDPRKTDMNEIIVKVLFNIKRDPNTTDSVSVNFSSDINGGTGV